MFDPNNPIRLLIDFSASSRLLFMKCKVAHSKNLIRGKNDNKSVLNKNDIIDGMKIFIDNSNVRERHDEIDNIKLHSMYT